MDSMEGGEKTKNIIRAMSKSGFLQLEGSKETMILSSRPVIDR